MVVSTDRKPLPSKVPHRGKHHSEGFPGSGTFLSRGRHQHPINTGPVLRAQAPDGDVMASTSIMLCQLFQPPAPSEVVKPFGYKCIINSSRSVQLQQTCGFRRPARTTENLVLATRVFNPRVFFFPCLLE